MQEEKVAQMLMYVANEFSREECTIEEMIKFGVSVIVAALHSGTFTADDVKKIADGVRNLVIDAADHMQNNLTPEQEEAEQETKE